MSFFRTLFSWAQRMLRGISSTFSVFPKGWITNGIIAISLTLVPLWFWLSSFERPAPYQSKVGWGWGACPPTQPIPRQELFQHPERFRNRSIWITGVLMQTPPRCLKLGCQKPPCCFPCFSKLFLGPAPFAIPLGGLLRQEGKNPLPVRCRDTTCKKQCAPFVLGSGYAFAGRPAIVQKRDPTTGQPTFELAQFRLERYCRFPSSRQPKQQLRLPDPLHTKVPSYRSTTAPTKKKR